MLRGEDLGEGVPSLEGEDVGFRGGDLGGLGAGKESCRGSETKREDSVQVERVSKEETGRGLPDLLLFALIVDCSHRFNRPAPPTLKNVEQFFP